jgi:hypothetical protein
MEFGKAFTFQFEDKDWIKKLLIAALIPLIPIIGTFFTVGWGVEITKRVIHRDPQPLADWNDFGGYFVKGLKVFVIGLVYAIPLILLSICPTVLLIASGDGDNTLANIAMAAFACYGLLAIIYGVTLALIMPAAIGRFAATDQIGAALKLGEIYGLVKAAPMAYLMVVLGTIVAGFIASLGTIACGVGALATSAYAATITAQLQGQAYLQATPENTTTI